MQRRREAGMFDYVIRAAGPPSGHWMQLGMLTNDPEIGEAEVLHHPRRRADVAGLARLDKDDADHWSLANFRIASSMRSTWPRSLRGLIIVTRRTRRPLSNVDVIQAWPERINFSRSAALVASSLRWRKQKMLNCGTCIASKSSDAMTLSYR